MKKNVLLKLMAQIIGFMVGQMKKLFYQPLLKNAQFICCQKKTFEFKKETILKEYKECFVIQSEREFNTKDIIQFKDRDFEVKYKYNKELEQHQLYIDYIIDTIKLSNDLIIGCKENYNKIFEYKRDQEESKKFKNKIKKLFKRF